MQLPDYAAFIITYRRPEILAGTIKALAAQTHPPGEVLVVDNDPEQSAEEVALSFSDAEGRVSYHPVGYNSGAAGGAYYGLKILSGKSWPWIQWIDDDDPPRFPRVNERLFELVADDLSKDIGIITPSGNDFSLVWAKSKRYSNKELLQNRILYPKTVGGGQGMLISKRVVDSGCKPYEPLFFGFEELDFCLQAVQSGFQIIAPTELFIAYRKEAGRWDFGFEDRRKQSYRIPPWRMYYSIRNLIYIFHYRQGRPLTAAFVAFRTLVKSLMYDLIALRSKRIQMTTRAIIDGYRAKLGQTVIPD